ncbi:MAG: hypothetical protein IKJ59_06280 [Clostridia bacterium]|nr:hypothetical protein [Clostridia bacterium]
MSVVGILIGLSVTFSKEFKNGLKITFGCTGKDLIEMMVVVFVMAETGVCGSRCRQISNLTNYTLK